ncbi:MAG TPA: peroxiredoxin [Gammaproteobacteria bacterium]|nr:peroxiredoxin [Gammaproteobacteria bacterium]
MAHVVLGKKIPAFKLPATSEQQISLSGLKGKNVVLYFYPKDNTPGCTREGQNFHDNLLKFKRQNTVVLGVSRDSLKSHDNFRSRQGFKFDLISDNEETLCNIFDVIKMKHMYGKQVRGIERSTFLIDGQGKLRQEWRKVKVDGHVDEVLRAVKQLNKEDKTNQGPETKIV